MMDNRTPPGTQSSYPATDVTDNDKLMALLAYIFSPLTAGIFLLMEGTKRSQFQYFHSVQALGLGVVNVVLSIVLNILATVLAAFTCGLSCLITLVPLAIWVAQIYYGIQAYQGKYFEIPYLSQFMRQQGWLK